MRTVGSSESIIHIAVGIGCQFGGEILSVSSSLHPWPLFSPRR